MIVEFSYCVSLLDELCGLRYSSEVISLFKRLGVEPLVIELDLLGMLFFS